MNVSISMVNADNKKLTLECLDSIYKNSKGIEFEVILVDNDSSDGSVEAIQQNYPFVRLIESKVKKGFTANQNMAIKACQGEFVLVLNNDTVIYENAINRLYDFMKSCPAAGAAGPCILNPDGSIQITSLRGPYSLTNLFSMKTGLSLLFPKSRLWGNIHLGHLDRTFVHEMAAFSGAAVMIRKKVFDEVGFLDENIEFGPDDIEFSLRLTKQGYKIYYVPDANILHYWGQTAKSNTPKYFAMEHEGLLYVYLKHYGVMKTIILRSMILIGCIPHLVINLISSLAVSRKNESMIWVRAYFEVMKVCITYTLKKANRK